MNQSEMRTLGLLAAGLVLLPFALLAGGLTITSAVDCVLLAVVGLGLNVLLGQTGLVSFGHGAWFGIGAYAVAILQLRFFPDSVVLPIALAIVIVAFSAVLIGALCCVVAASTFRCSRWRSVRFASPWRSAGPR